MTHHEDTGNAMDLFTATTIAEGQFELAGVDPANDDVEGLVIDTYQKLIDTGAAWQLQGFFGRNAAHMIEEGYCHE